MNSQSPTRKAVPITTKTWNWNAAQLLADEAHQKKVRDAQRRFRNAV